VDWLIASDCDIGMESISAALCNLPSISCNPPVPSLIFAGWYTTGNPTKTLVCQAFFGTLEGWYMPVYTLECVPAVPPHPPSALRLA